MIPAADDDWLLSDKEIRDMLRRRSPHLDVDSMTIGEVCTSLTRNVPRPACPSCGVHVLVFCDPNNADEAPQGDNTHRCAACGRQCRLEIDSCA